MRNYLIAATFMFFSSQVSAVVYTFTGNSWKQLQDSTTYSTLCESGSLCDVPAGTYNLIDFATNPATVTKIEINENQSSEQSIIVSEACLQLEVTIGRGCMAQCPLGTTIKRIRTCLAQGTYKPKPTIGTSFSSDDTQVSCRIGPVGGSTSAVDIYVELECE